jgi:hypothetical protein
VHKQQARFISPRSPCHLGVLFEDDDRLLERQRRIQLVAAGDMRSSRPSYMRRSRFSVMCHDSRDATFPRCFLNYRASLVIQRTSCCNTSQFQLSWVPSLTWPTATIHEQKRNTYVICPCSPCEGTCASRGIVPLINLARHYKEVAVKPRPPASLPLCKRALRCYYRLGWPQNRSRKGKQLLNLPGIETQLLIKYNANIQTYS